MYHQSQPLPLPEGFVCHHGVCAQYYSQVVEIIKARGRREHIYKSYHLMGKKNQGEGYWAQVLPVLYQ